ncbi:sugar phosphate isomerase/epimerase [Novosphingobium sp. PY1]|uniref:sugar phosphate isomerase/epimerase family protein n=1 Tax=Novosphingobium sp. PY1 TaxID=1882221 RepID=UPI001A8DC0DE|nr:TIM barrel protein [Novosphingobium sp. PY1]GFM27607.1 xylose isomerase-like TIM barrel domain-containing protein [Novosphingobium sp. PY1]
MSGFKYGVSLYSYTDDLGTVMTLEDAFDHVAETGSTGIEILGEANIAGYPEPSSAWLDNWFALIDRYKLEPTNLASWLDTCLTLDHTMSVEEGTAQVAQDLRLANQLGFKFIRPKFGVIDEELTPHPIWEATIERNLDLAHQLGIVIIPEIHAPTPIKHPVTDAYIEFIERTGTKNFGIMIDTGIFQDRPLPYWPGETPEIRAAALSFLDGIKVPVEHLADVIQYVPFIQAKFHHIDENLHDHHIPWENVIPMLKKLGYTGYLSSEYEGVRDPWVAIEQVRRQHCLIRKLERDLEVAPEKLDA